MASSSAGGLWPRSPSLGPSSRSSANLSRSQDELLPGQTANRSANQATAGSVPDAPPQSQRVIAENPAQATNRRIVSLQPKIINPSDGESYNDLKYWPTILQMKAVTMLVLLYVATATGISVLVWKTMVGSNHTFRLSSENVRMISRYFPSIIGTVTVLLFRQTVREALRMEPFTNMADQKRETGSGTSSAEGVGGAWFPWQSITTTPPSLLSVSSLVGQFLVSFVVSLKVALLASTEHVDADNEEHYWILAVRLYPAALLILMYIVMIILTLFIAYHFRGKSTGLKWDPVSIADYAALFAHCNALQCFAQLELQHDLRPEHVMVPSQLFRLGYWTRVRDNPPQEDEVYGIGVRYSDNGGNGQGAQPERQQLGRPWKDKILLRRQKLKPLPVDSCKRPLGCAHGTWPSCEHYPYNENPGCSRKLILLASIFPITALALSIYALIIRLPFEGFSLRNNLRLPSSITWNAGHGNHTLPPLDPTDPNSNVLVWALMFRSAPTYVAGLFTSTIVAWIDLNMRFMQPFRNMFGVGPKKSPYQRIKDFFGWRHWMSSSTSAYPAVGDIYEPAKAEDSILLAYITVSPLQVPLTAWDKGHFKVCIYSTLNTLSPLFPIFVGALLIVTPDQDYNRVQFTFSLSAYIGVMVSLVLYSVLLPAAVPGAYRLLPRQLYSLADLMALCHESKFMSSPHLDITKRERTPSKEHMEARILLEDPHFLFGIYQGRDGRQHLGFDVTQYRENDFGAIRTIPDSVWHVPPEGLIVRFRRAMTSAMEDGRSAGRAITGTMSAAVGNPFSQHNRGIHEHEDEHEHELRLITEAEASGSQRRNDEIAGQPGNAFPRRPPGLVSHS